MILFSRSRRFSLVRAVMAAGALLASSAVLRAAAPKPPNIVLIFADDLGYGDLGCFGNPTIQTPNLDRLAQRGVRLTSFYSAPTCVPARTQLMIGKYSGRLDLNGSVGPGSTNGLPDDEITLPEALKGAGYATGMAGKWHLGNAQDKFLPPGQGFDSWLGLPHSNDMQRPWVETDVPLWLFEGSKKIENPVNQDTLTERYTERAVTFIKQNHARPFFFYLAPAMPHLPLHVGDKFRGKSRGGLYGDAVEEIDWAVGEVLRTLRETGIDQNTLVIFASDNGPWIEKPPRMLQAGNLDWHVGSAGTLRGSKGSTFEGGVRTPAIVYWPGHFEGGWSTGEPTATMDLYATFIALAGGKGNPVIDGYNLTDFLENKAPKSPRQEFYYFNANRLDGVRVGAWKLRLKDGVELTDLDLDPAERYNRAKEQPEVVARLTALLKKMADETKAVHQW